MKPPSRSVVWLSVILLGFGFLFVSPVTAEESMLEEMEGNGSEANPYVITDVEELQAMDADQSGRYVLGNDIDASKTAAWNAGSGFEPIGHDSDSFAGSLDGKGYTISNLVVDRPTENNVGLIGHTSGTIENVHLEEADVRGQDSVGTLTGKSTGEVRQSSASGEVSGSKRVGGLIGSVDSGAVAMSSADVDVESELQAGGVVGYLDGGSISKTHAHGDVHGEAEAGGIVPRVNEGSAVRLSYAIGNVIAGTEGGGVVGTNLGLVTSSFATGESQSGYDRHGGIVGANVLDGYDASVTDSYWDIDASGRVVGSYNHDVGTGLRTPEMTGVAAERNMETFDFENFWTATDEYPVLRWQIQEVSISLDEPTVTAGDRTGVTVTLTLDDGSTVTASEVADYEIDEGAAVDAGVVETIEQGTTEITATVAGENDTASLEITEPPNIELEDASLAAPAVVNGSEVTVAATYANDGGPGGYTAELLVDGESVASERIWVGADDETTVEFGWTPAGDAETERTVAIDETGLGTLTVVKAETVSLESVSVPEQVGLGASYEVVADLESAHDDSVFATVTYELGSEDSATESVVIDPDGSTASFDREPDANVGTTLHQTVTLANESLEGISEVAEPPAFEITALEAPDEIEAGHAFDLTATIENTGGLEGTQTIALTNEDELTSEAVTVGAGATETVSLTVTESDASDYEYTVSSADDEAAATVSVTDETEADGNGTDDESDGDSDGVPGFGTITALVAASLVALLMWR